MSLDNDNFPLSFTLTGSGETLTITSYFLAEADLVVTSKTGTAETALVLTTNYTVTGEGNQLGGTVVMVAGVSGDVITVGRNAALEQPEDLSAGGQFPATTLTQMVDRLGMQVQQLNAEVKRSVRLTLADTAIAAVVLADRASKYLGFDSSGDLELKAATDGTGTVIESVLATSIGVTQSDSSAGDPLIFNTSNAPTVSLTEGTWTLNGGVSVRTSDGNDAIWAQFYDNTNSVAFGGGPAVSNEQKRLPISVTGTIVVAAGATIVIYFKVFTITYTLDIGSSTPSGPAGFISAVRVA